MDSNKDIPENDKFLTPLERGQNPFSVPADYFDALPEKIMNNIHSTSKKNRPFFLFKPAIALSSCAVLFSIISLLIFLNKGIPSGEILLSDNDIQKIIDNPELYNLNDEAVTDQYISSDISDEAITESDLPEEEVKSDLEENINLQNIINEY